MTQRNFILVSPPVPCGVSWLVNVLLELGIKTTQVNEHPQWVETAGGLTFAEPLVQEQRGYLPIAHRREPLQFQNDLEVFWEHRLDFAREPWPAILFVRDPRDALYSHYLRHYSKSRELSEFLRWFSVWTGHLPGMFVMPPAETLAWFCEFWLAQAAYRPVLVLRFEDSKTRPVEVAQQALQFLGVERDEREISRAVEASTFERARQALQNSTRTGLLANEVIRKGAVSEWKTAFNPLDLSHFGGPSLQTFERLGYSMLPLLPPQLPVPLPPIDAPVQALVKQASSNMLDRCTEATLELLLNAPYSLYNPIRA